MDGWESETDDLIPVVRFCLSKLKLTKLYFCTDTKYVCACVRSGEIPAVSDGLVPLTRAEVRRPSGH